MSVKRINDLVSQALALEAQEAKEAGALGYMDQRAHLNQKLRFKQSLRIISW